MRADIHPDLLIFWHPLCSARVQYTGAPPSPSMNDHYLSSQHDPGNLLGQVGVHFVRPLARPEMHNLRGPYDLDSLMWQYLAYVYGHEMPFVISDGANPRTSWSQSVDGLTARSPILSRGQILENPRPLTHAPDNGNENFGDQAGAVPNCRTQAGYNQHVTKQEEQIITGRAPLKRGTDSPPPGGNFQLCFPCSANTVSSDVCPSQVPQQHWEELKEARQDPNTRSAWNSKNRSKAFASLHHCTNCDKAYQRPQDLKRHTRDKHFRQRKCPFCCTGWSRPERIRFHLIQKHASLLTLDQHREIRSLRGRHDTIHFLANCGNTIHPQNDTPD